MTDLEALREEKIKQSSVAQVDHNEGNDNVLSAERFEVDYIISRNISDGFKNCVRRNKTEDINILKAREQHKSYLSAINLTTPSLMNLEQDHELPDCVFVEDTIIIIDHDTAMITRPGAPSRKREPLSIAAGLIGKLYLKVMQEPATMDGGDVLRIGNNMVVGLSSRTNQLGISFLEEIANEKGIRIITAELPHALHLKSTCSLADENNLVYDPKSNLDMNPFESLGVNLIPVPEPEGANVLALGHNNVLVSAQAPETQEILKDKGLKVHSVNISEFHKADGALTCASVRIPKKGAWCT